MLKKCPFCGFQPDIEDADFCYPVGKTTLWQAGCPEPAGGCGARVLGNTKELAIEAWNTRKFWFDIKEKEPPFEELILVSNEERISLAIYHRGLLGTPRWWQFFSWTIQPTHWAYIPD